MDELIIRNKETELVSALHYLGEDLPDPFERDVFLLGTDVAGTSYRENIAEIFAILEEGDPIALIREPENPYDEYAIRLEIDRADSEEAAARIGAYEGTMVGYVPRGVKNKIFSRLMDAGKLLFAVVRAKEEINGYFRIVVKVYLKD